MAMNMRAEARPVRLGSRHRRTQSLTFGVSLALLVVIASTAHCAPAMAADPATVLTPVELTLVGGPTLNPNAQGRPSPVIVRIFDLAASQSFETAAFAALFEHPDDALKQDLLAQDEFVLHPGEIQQKNRGLEPRVQALGVVAAFRDLEQAVWRLSVPVKPGRRIFLLINLDRNTIRLVPVDSGQS